MYIGRKTENVDGERDRPVNGTLFREGEREHARMRERSSIIPEAVQYPNDLIRRAAASSKLREWRDLFIGTASLRKIARGDAKIYLLDRTMIAHERKRDKEDGIDFRKILND